MPMTSNLRSTAKSPNPFQPPRRRQGRPCRRLDCVRAELLNVDLVQRFERPKHKTRVSAPPDAPPIVILPGFGNESGDYLQPFGNEEASLAAALRRRGFKAEVLPVQRRDWFRVARALLTVKFWSSNLTTHPGYTWYLERVKATVQRALAEHGGEQVIVVGHSAGGWLARAFIGDPRWWRDPAAADTNGGLAYHAPNPAVRMLVTLGTPHSAPPPELVRDVTGGALRWVDTTFPTAFLQKHGIPTICVAGATVTGKKRESKEEPRSPPLYAHDSYTQVCGRGQGVVGDAVVPLESALLEGARHVVLPGVFHSMSKLGTWDTESGYVWYGSEDVVDLWLKDVVQELEAPPHIRVVSQIDAPQVLAHEDSLVNQAHAP